jgi:hypothetical protein
MFITAIVAYAIPVIFGLALYVNLVRRRSIVEGIATAWALGWGAVYLILLVSNYYFNIHFSEVRLAVVALGLIIISIPLLWRQRGLFKNVARHIMERYDKNQALLLIPLIPLLILIVYKSMQALGGFDELVYHAYLPALIYDTGTVPTNVNSLWSNLPNAYPNFFVLQQSWIYYVSGSGNDVYVRLLPLIYSVLIIGLIYSITTRLYSARAGIYSIFIFASTPLFVYMSVRFIAGMPLAFFLLIALNYFIRWEIENEGSFDKTRLQTYLLLAGLFLGFATTVKYNGLVAALAAVGVMGYKARSRLLWVIFGLAIASGPFYMRNYILYGNPIFPFFDILFQGTEIQMLTLHEVQYTFGNPIGAALNVLLTVSFILSLIYLYSIIKEKQSMTLFLIPLVTFGLVFVIQPAPVSFDRYVFFIFPIISVIAGRSLEWLIHDKMAEWLKNIKTSFDKKNIAQAVAVVLCILIIIPSYGNAVDIKYDIYPDGSFKAASDDGVLQNQGEYLKVARWMDSNLPAYSKVLSFEVRRYYIDTDLVPADSDIVFDTYNTDLTSALQHIRSLGVTHILDVSIYHDEAMTKPLYDQSPIFQNLDNASFIRLQSSGDTVLYEIDYDFAFGRLIDINSDPASKQKWMDIQNYISLEKGNISQLTNANTTMELSENGTRLTISPSTGGALRLWLDIIVAPPQQFFDIKSKYISRNLTFDEKNGDNGTIYVYAVGSERFFTAGPHIETKPRTISTNITFDTSDYKSGGFHIVFLRKVLI